MGWTDKGEAAPPKTKATRKNDTTRTKRTIDVLPQPSLVAFDYAWGCWVDRDPLERSLCVTGRLGTVSASMVSEASERAASDGVCLPSSFSVPLCPQPLAALNPRRTHHDRSNRCVHPPAPRLQGVNWWSVRLGSERGSTAPWFDGSYPSTIPFFPPSFFPCAASFPC